MNPTPPPDLHVFTQARQLTYSALLADSDRMWTVGDIAGYLPDVPVNRLRTTLLLLLDGRVLDIEPCTGRPVLTLRMTDGGKRLLADIVRGWADTRTGSAASTAPGERDRR